MTKPTVDKFVEMIKQKMETMYAKKIEDATPNEVYYALSSLVSEILNKDWLHTDEKYDQRQPKQVYYLSMEFLIGRLLESNLLNMGLREICNESLKQLNFSPEDIYNEENDPGLGNGGLGRLAACFLDSLATLNYPGHGFGIRYRYGMFEQRFINGYQTELPDYWLKNPYAWETRKADEAIELHFGGSVHMFERNDGKLEFKYQNTDKVLAVPYDVPIVGYHNKLVNTLRLWNAEPINRTDQPADDSSYYKHLKNNHAIEQISSMLYPDDSNDDGKRLRIKQQYFLVASSLRTIVNNYKKNTRESLIHLPKKVVIQINDTHPSLAIPELMRMLMDEEGFSWEHAWQITTNVFAYTNHTIMSEALEKWPVKMIQSLLPRLYMIIDEINERFCQNIWFDHPELRDKIPGMAIIAHDQIHMAHLAIVGSFSVNGVAKLHSDILKKQEMKNFYNLYPNRFNNKTNGITHRRWLLMSNPRLADVISETIGQRWIQRPRELTHLLRHTKDNTLLEKLSQVKKKNKRNLAEYIHETTGILVDENSIFDVQIKRLHEYKRQLLNIFHVIYLYNELKDNPSLDITPRTFIFAAKAAPSYYFAKEVIKLINTVASVVNHDPTIQDKIKVIFLENYNTSLAEKIIPAADVSEQISTAGKEASGTGNMKMMMNGALTIGTLDGANIEIKNQVGDSNIFIFGLHAEEVYNYYQDGSYSPNEIYQNDERITQIMDQLRSGAFGHDVEFTDIYYHLLSTNDPYFILKDFESYVETQQQVDRIYRDQNKWLSKSLINIAHSGKFSSDRTIQEYATGIWKLQKQYF
ncbi:alpha-1,4 glucan phosphorylase [Paraliobacillus quinghaiensis]|uniref:Alpha-1,4 glucan phosphorylase n=1 Tax=Paraliobacillus quinghaiensis TaxID=470815 RepID=A0A917WNP1_9BACI|nr:glycogen/starch/alpha-glucan phosphorylase [Paraliobacillus quinghaiensis]GGM19108.1 alpha-1,4 glucan phosphorylase [Paraliobacillus quinghaiensis]